MVRARPEHGANQTQIPFGDDRKKGKGTRRSPWGMTSKGRQGQTQIPLGDDRRKASGAEFGPGIWLFQAMGWPAAL